MTGDGAEELSMRSGRDGSSDRGLGVARLTRLLDEIQRMCGTLDRLSLRQGEELDAGRPEEAARVVAERAVLVARLGDAAREMGEGGSAIDSALAGATIEQAERAREQASAIAAIVGQVLARDAEDARLMSAERDRLAAEMAGLGRGREAIGAYGSTGEPAPTMQDRRG